MATSQAEVSKELRITIREMVQEGRSNQEIYEHVQSEYGPDQIAIPHQGYLYRLSYGLPYVAVGLMILVAYWLAWSWWVRGEEHRVDAGSLSDEEKKELDKITGSVDSPLN